MNKSMPQWTYNRLITNMKRWSFSSKMSKACTASMKLLNPKAKDPSILRMMVLPHEIETYTMLAIKEKEWQSSETTEHEFAKSIDAIRAFRHPKLFSQKGISFGKWLVMLIKATQFDFQFNEIFRINRYYEYFDYKDENIDMSVEIKKKFGISYSDIAGPIILLWMHLSGEIQLSDNQKKWLIMNYRKTFDILTLTRDEYINELDDITPNKEDYVYCLRPSYSWPLIRYEDHIYLPTPHLLVRAVTVSLMHRLTFQNISLREKIGKYVLESYLYRLICGSDEFQEKLPEQEYAPGKRTLDVLTRVDDSIICFDSKSCAPQIGIRTFDPEAYRRTKDKIVKGFVQAYKHIRYKYGKEYTFFTVPVKQDRSNIYAVVVLADNPFCPLDEIHEEAATQLGLQIPSDEYDWLRGHVGIADIDAIETQVLQKKNFLEAISENARTKQYSDYWFLQGKITNDEKKTEYMEDNVTALLMSVIKEMDYNVV